MADSPSVTRERCPECGDFVPEENDETGEGPVFWTRSDEPFCGMECVVAHHRKYLKDHPEERQWL